MECNIKYADKWDNEEVYYCVTHHKKASIMGKKLSECIDLLKGVNNILKINEKETSVLYIGKSMIEKRDFGGLLISKLNNVDLEVEVCPYCGNIHSDDGKFVYLVHNPHLCAYCGKFFQVDHPNIGNEIATIFKISEVKLADKCIEITSKLKIDYDVLNGLVLVNDICCDKIIINNKQYYLKDYLNEKLYNEF